MASGSSSKSILELKVGGYGYTTTFKTIQHSKLGGMFMNGQDIAEDSQRELDRRDGSLFRHVLNFLRTGELCLPRSFDEFERLRDEADFYEVDGLIEAIEARGDVIIIIDNKTDELSVTCRGKLMKKVFEGLIPTKRDLEEEPDTQTTKIPKADAFNLLYWHGFQLEGRNGQVNNVEYIFARRNRPEAS